MKSKLFSQKSVPLGRLCRYENGGTPSKKNLDFWNGTIPWITSAEIQDSLVLPARSYITTKGVENSAAKQVPAGTLLLVTRTGVGKVAFAPNALSFSQDITAINPDHSKLDSRYLFQFISANQSYFLRNSRGATIKGITRDVLNRLEIPLPPLSEQKRIAGILDAADALRAKRREAIAQLDTLLQATFIDMFGDPVTNPKGWKVCKFSTLGQSRLGKMLDKGKQAGNCQFPYLANYNVQWGTIKLDELRTMDFDEGDRQEFALLDGDLLVCEGGEVGRTAIWRNQMDNVYFQKALHRVRVDRTIAVPEYIQYFMWFMAKNGGFKDFTTVATIAHLTGIKLKNLPTPIPPLDLQHRFAAIVELIEQQKARMHAHLADLDAFFASLQSRAFNGEL